MQSQNCIEKLRGAPGTVSATSLQEKLTTEHLVLPFNQGGSESSIWGEKGRKSKAEAGEAADRFLPGKRETEDLASVPSTHHMKEG